MSSMSNETRVRRSSRLESLQAAQKRSRSSDERIGSKKEEKRSSQKSPHRKMQRTENRSSPSSLAALDHPAPKRHSNLKKPSATVMTTFMKSYKGLDDWHLPLFVETKKYLEARGIPKPDVFYPGSHKHVQASLIFPKVTYLDCDAKLEKHFGDPGIAQWIESNTTYDGASEWAFECRNFEQLPRNYDGRFDLMVSACAGFVVKPCGHTPKVDTGYLLVSDAHFDARAAYVDPRFELAAVWDGKEQELKESKEDLAGHFTTAGGAQITEAQVTESAAKPKRARSFRLVKEAMFYLFRRVR